MLRESRGELANPVSPGRMFICTVNLSYCDVCSISYDSMSAGARSHVLRVSNVDGVSGPWTVTRWDVHSIFCMLHPMFNGIILNSINWATYARGFPDVSRLHVFLYLLISGSSDSTDRWRVERITNVFKSTDMVETGFGYSFCMFRESDYYYYYY